MTLFEMMARCLEIRDTHVEGSGDYALDYRCGTLYVYFEKTEGASDWRSNLDFPARAYRRMGTGIWLAHRGFLDVWRGLEPVLAPTLLDKSVLRIIPVGYSHGAALATLCHEYLWYNRPELRESLSGFGFGAPRVLWGAISRRYSARWEGFTVIRNVPDAVTHLPPRTLGFFHVGTMLEIGQGRQYSPIDAHRPESYLSELEGLNMH